MIHLTANALRSKSHAAAHAQKYGPLALTIVVVLFAFLLSPLLAILVSGLMLCHLAKPSLRVEYSDGSVETLNFSVKFGGDQNIELPPESCIVSERLRAPSMVDLNSTHVADRH